MTSDDFTIYKYLLADEKSRLEAAWQRLSSSEGRVNRVRSAVYQRLQEIESAQERIADGTYGRCTQCGQSIPPERLQNVPHAAYCLACQLLFESGNDSGSENI